MKNYGLFLDQSLDVGHSYPCATFNNTQLHPLAGSQGASFGVDVVERAFLRLKRCEKLDRSGFCHNLLYLVFIASPDSFLFWLRFVLSSSSYAQPSGACLLFR